MKRYPPTGVWDMWEKAPRSETAPLRVLILGAGFAGIYTALELEKLTEGMDVEVVLVNRDNFFLYYPMLPEVVSGGIEPRHVVVPLRTLFSRCKVFEGVATEVDLDNQRVTIHQEGLGCSHVREYDHLVIATGATTNLRMVPGVEEHAFTFRTLPDAMRLRNQIVDNFEKADIERDPTLRAELLTFVVVGGGSTGIEVLGELEAYVHGIRRYYPSICKDDVRIVLLERAPRLIPEVSEELADYAAKELVRRGIDVRFGTSLARVTDRCAELTDGTVLPTRALIWTIGLTPTQFTRQLPLPHDEKGWLVAESTMHVPGKHNVWALGDCAKVPGPDGKPYPPTAQHAVREAKQLARNILAASQGRPLTPYHFEPLGSLVSIGGNRGVALLKGRPVRGYLAWWLWRAVHFMLLPGADRRIRVGLDWLLSALLRKDIVQINYEEQAKPAGRPSSVVFLREEPTEARRPPQS